MKKKRLILGITGGIATGKSTVIKMLAKAGIPGISSDALAHEAIRKGKPAYRQILKRYGKKLLRYNGQLCRMKLGRIVFSDPKERLWLEQQVHPYVIKKLKNFARAHTGTVALDIPLLFEAGLESLVDKIVVVAAPRAAQIRRLKQRNGLSTADANHRISAQWPLSKKIRSADVVLYNDATLRSLQKQVKKELGV